MCLERGAASKTNDIKTRVVNVGLFYKHGACLLIRKYQEQGRHDKPLEKQCNWQLPHQAGTAVALEGCREEFQVPAWATVWQEDVVVDRSKTYLHEEIYKMKFQKTLLAVALAGATISAHAAPVAWTGTFDMYDPTGAQMDANDGGAGLSAAVTGTIDLVAGTFTLASTDTFFGQNWYTHDSHLYVGSSPQLSAADSIGSGCVDPNTLACATTTQKYAGRTLAADEVLGWTKFQYGYDPTNDNGDGTFGAVVNDGIDVVMLWKVTTDASGTHYVMQDIDRLSNTTWTTNGIPGTKMIDGPFPGFSANFNMTTVPEASTYGMMLAGLGLVGFAVRRRKQVI